MMPSPEVQRQERQHGKWNPLKSIPFLAGLVLVTLLIAISSTPIPADFNIHTPGFEVCPPPC